MWSADRAAHTGNKCLINHLIINFNCFSYAWFALRSATEDDYAPKPRTLKPLSAAQQAKLEEQHDACKAVIANELLPSFSTNGIHGLYIAALERMEVVDDIMTQADDLTREATRRVKEARPDLFVFEQHVKAQTARHQQAAATLRADVKAAMLEPTAKSAADPVVDPAAEPISETAAESSKSSSSKKAPPKSLPKKKQAKKARKEQKEKTARRRAERDRVRRDIKKKLRIANGPPNDDKMASEARKAAKKTRRALIKEEVVKRQAEINKAFEEKYAMSISDWSKPGAYVDLSRFFFLFFNLLVHLAIMPSTSFSALASMATDGSDLSPRLVSKTLDHATCPSPLATVCCIFLADLAFPHPRYKFDTIMITYLFFCCIVQKQWNIIPCLL